MLVGGSFIHSFPAGLPQIGGSDLHVLSHKQTHKSNEAFSESHVRLLLRQGQVSVRVPAELVQRGKQVRRDPDTKA